MHTHPYLHTRIHIYACIHTHVRIIFFRFFHCQSFAIYNNMSIYILSACVCVTLYVGTICMCLCHPVCGNYLHVSVSLCMWELFACVCVTLYVGTICMCLCHPVCGNYLHVSVSLCMWELFACVCVTLYVGTICMCLCRKEWSSFAFVIHIHMHRDSVWTCSLLAWTCKF